jgi:hypothetical protein
MNDEWKEHWEAETEQAITRLSANHDLLARKMARLVRRREGHNDRIKALVVLAEKQSSSHRKLVEILERYFKALLKEESE